MVLRQVGEGVHRKEEGAAPMCTTVLRAPLIPGEVACGVGEAAEGVEVVEVKAAGDRFEICFGKRVAGFLKETGPSTSSTSLDCQHPFSPSLDCTGSSLWVPIFVCWSVALDQSAHDGEAFLLPQKNMSWSVTLDHRSKVTDKLMFFFGRRRASPSWALTATQPGGVRMVSPVNASGC